MEAGKGREKKNDFLIIGTVTCRAKLYFCETQTAVLFLKNIRPDSILLFFMVCILLFNYNDFKKKQ